MGKIIMFEWRDYEKKVWGGMQTSLEFSHSPAVFDLDTARGFEVVSIFIDSKISDADLAELARDGCKLIAIRATGYDMLDVEKAKSLGVKVARVARYSPESVAEHVFALTLFLARRFNRNFEQLEQGLFQRDARMLGFTLHGKKLGLYGMGKIGQATARIAQGFGMQVSYYDSFVPEFESWRSSSSLPELVADLDILSIQVPLTDQTHYSINSEVLEKCRQGMVLINTSRADIVEPEAALKALDSGKLSGMGVDVWDTGDRDDMFDQRLKRQNVIQTNHIGFFTTEAVQEILHQTLENIQGQPRAENQL